MDVMDALFSGQEFMPRRYCGTWSGSLIGLHVVSDTIIWLSYLWIPLVMIWAYRRNKTRLRLQQATLWLLVLYVLFITACGWTHFFDMLMFWNPVYRLNGVVRAVTAVVSLAAAVALVKLAPLAINAPATILMQRETLHQQFLWLRDILDSTTGGRLHLCETENQLPEIPEPSDAAPVVVPVADARDLRRVRQEARRQGEALGLSDIRVDDLISAVHEAAMNALVHAGGGQVQFYVGVDRLQVRTTDTGPGIPLDRLPISTLKQGYSTAGSAGQGWSMLLSFVDAAYLVTGPDGTTVAVTMSKSGAPVTPLYSIKM